MTLSVNQTQPLLAKTKFKFKIKTPQNESPMDVDPNLNNPKKSPLKLNLKQHNPHNHNTIVKHNTKTLLLSV